MYIFACQKYSSITGQHYYFSRKRVLVLYIYNEIIAVYVFRVSVKLWNCIIMFHFALTKIISQNYSFQKHTKNLFLAFLSGIQSFEKYLTNVYLHTSEFHFELENNSKCKCQLVTWFVFCIHTPHTESESNKKSSLRHYKKNLSTYILTSFPAKRLNSKIHILLEYSNMRLGPV